ncbi:hypothetical protein [Rhizobium phaseoli]|uniref:hypothetical protein n=1 Tax=Rhizobium phaseoli TaxID=396 RepID=UPI002555F192|nr:hypothetical protein [Rhizobium phaseoli]MDK4724939.1 hypothetical protein [Rhizobium phaseoli]
MKTDTLALRRDDDSVAGKRTEDDLTSLNYGQLHVLAWLASKTSTTKSAMSGSISLACLAWNDGGAFMISVRLPISVSMTHIIAPNVMMAAVNNMMLVMAVL